MIQLLEQRVFYHYSFWDSFEWLDIHKRQIIQSTHDRVRLVIESLTCSLCNTCASEGRLLLSHLIGFRSQWWKEYRLARFSKEDAWTHFIRDASSVESENV